MGHVRLHIPTPTSRKGFAMGAIGYVATFVGGVVTTILLEHARRWWFSPKLDVVLREDEYGKVATSFQLDPDYKPPPLHEIPPDRDTEAVAEMIVAQLKKRAQYVRLRVRNVGWSTAQQVRGFLVDVRILDPKNGYERIFFDSIPLCWSYVLDGNRTALDIPRNVNINLDVFHTVEGEHSFTPCFAAMPEAYSNRFRNADTYILTVAVVAENATPRVVEIEVRWNGRWNDFEYGRHRKHIR